MIIIEVNEKRNNDPKIKGEGGKQMAICFRETAKEFHLYNEKISYILTVLENGQLGHLYFGKVKRQRKLCAYVEFPGKTNVGLCF